jgi:hypothetical protein
LKSRRNEEVSIYCEFTLTDIGETLSDGHLAGHCSNQLDKIDQGLRGDLVVNYHSLSSQFDWWGQFEGSLSELLRSEAKGCHINIHLMSAGEGQL